MFLLTIPEDRNLASQNLFGLFPRQLHQLGWVEVIAFANTIQPPFADWGNDDRVAIEGPAFLHTMDSPDQYAV